MFYVLVFLFGIGQLAYATIRTTRKGIRMWRKESESLEYDHGEAPIHSFSSLSGVDNFKVAIDDDEDDDLKDINKFTIDTDTANARSFNLQPLELTTEFIVGMYKFVTLETKI